MSLPRVAIVGRPNVGKSSLLNMLARSKVSIVDATPGVTRDRVSTIIELEAPDRIGALKSAEVIDTGGYGVYTADGARYNEVGEDLSALSGSIEKQISEAVRTADLILFIVDAQTGITTLDETIAQMLRRRALSGEGGRHVPVYVVANKTDSDKWIPDAMEAAGLGFGEPIYLSAVNSRYKRYLLDRLYEAMPEGRAEDGSRAGEMRLAIVGKRNAGKSTFVNALAGEERVIANEIAGTTRDSIDVRVQFGERSLLVIDTAGFRKKKSIPDQVEWFAMTRALDSIRRCDVALLLIDATAPVSQVDKHLAREIQDRHKPFVIVVNKWDLAEGKTGRKGRAVTPEDYLEYLEKELVGVKRAPIVFTTATEDRNVADAVELAFDLFHQSQQRVPTGRLNRIFREILAHRGPSSKLGTRAKIYYVSQVAVSPPTIVVVVNKPELFTPEYERYLLNRLAELTPFEEVPIRLFIRERKRVDLQGLFEGEHLDDVDDHETAVADHEDLDRD